MIKVYNYTAVLQNLRLNNSGITSIQGKVKHRNSDSEALKYILEFGIGDYYSSLRRIELQATGAGEARSTYYPPGRLIELPDGLWRAKSFNHTTGERRKLSGTIIRRIDEDPATE
jgi:hypothetical protein